MVTAWLLPLAAVFSWSTAWATPSARTFTLMTYNAENLFDALHDKDKKDWTYLPLSVKRASAEIQAYCKSLSTSYRNECLNLDWTEEVSKKKMLNIAQVIKLHSPDVVVLQEVENLNILTQLKNIGLAGEGYKHAVLIEGPDSRGIDVGMISKLPLVGSPVLHRVDLSVIQTQSGQSARETRGILEASFESNGARFTVFANHWPSQNNPDENRMQAGASLYAAVLKTHYPVIAAGDFNTVDSNRSNAIEEYLVNPNRELYFYDSEKVHFDEQPYPAAPHRGTHYYGGKWSSLDRIFVLGNGRLCGALLGPCISPQWSGFKIVKENFMLRKDAPIRYDSKTGEGYSDHLPVLMTFSID
jgi:endonuclease/exonuclease/phosphatase family metal-dependent hydrolase